MKLNIQYINNEKGEIQGIQMSIKEWEKLMKKLKQYEQIIKIRSDLQKAIDEITELNKKRKAKQTLNDFLNEI
jgi:coenzyme F420-reducing hydrogenase delta subunit